MSCFHCQNMFKPRLPRLQYMEQEQLTPLHHPSTPQVFIWFRVALYIVICLMFCRSLFVL